MPDPTNSNAMRHASLLLQNLQAVRRKIKSMSLEARLGYLNGWSVRILISTYSTKKKPSTKRHFSHFCACTTDSLWPERQTDCQLYPPFGALLVHFHGKLQRFKSPGAVQKPSSHLNQAKYNPSSTRLAVYSVAICAQLLCVNPPQTSPNEQGGLQCSG